MLLPFYELKLLRYIVGLSIPFALFAVLYINSPGYIATLTGTPEGVDLLKWGGLGMIFGIYWISKLIKIDL